MKIKAYSDLSPLLTSALTPGVLSNGIPSPEDCRREIEAGTLDALKIGQGVILVRDRGDFVRLNWLLTPPIPEELPPEFLRRLKNAVAEIPGRAGDPKKAQAEAIFRRSGFDPLFRRIRMTRPKDRPMDRPMDRPTDVPISPAPDRDSTFSVGPAGPCEPDRTEIKNLLASSFDPLTGCLPTEKELGEILARGEILAARDGLTGELAGVLHLRSLRGAAEIRHLAVDPKFRRRGAGQKLVGEFLARTAGLRAVVWLREDNAPASALYASAGFAPDGWESAVLCRRQEI